MDSVNKTYKFPEVFCSNCGQAFGPGDNGFSHCENHAGLYPQEGTFWELVVDEQQRAKEKSE
jgi:hypothetical protein